MLTNTPAKTIVPLNAPTFDETEIQAAIDVLRSKQVTMSKNCARFEHDFSTYLRSKYAIFVNSGSSANLLAFFALTNPLCPTPAGKQKIYPGDEVIVPAVTWSTTIWPIVQAGLVPVLVDCDQNTFQMKPDSVKKALSSRTKIICPVHVLGNGVDMNFVLNFAEENKLWIIEDTCEALGSRYTNKYLGTMGDIGTYSFFFSHHITTIEGGMLLTQHAELADLVRCLREHGWSRNLENRKEIEAQYPEIDPRFLFVNAGFNLRPTEINAVFGIAQLKKLRNFNERRVEIATQWNQAFEKQIRNGFFTPMLITPNVEPIWFGYPILCKDLILRKQLLTHLESNGIETRPIICGNLARQPAFKLMKHRIADELSGADSVMQKGLFWGSHPLMTQEQITHVIEVVKEFFE